jgi:hypothetical protein
MKKSTIHFINIYYMNYMYYLSMHINLLDLYYRTYLFQYRSSLQKHLKTSEQYKFPSHLGYTEPREYILHHHCFAGVLRLHHHFYLHMYYYLLIQTAASKLTAAPGASQSGNKGSNT